MSRLAPALDRPLVTFLAWGLFGLLIVQAAGHAAA